MSDFDINFGPWLNYGNSNREDQIGDKMEELISAKWSPFNGCDKAQVFIYCMAYAFAKGRKPRYPPGGKSSGSMPASAFKSDMRNFMKVLAISHENGLDVVADPKAVVKIGQGYAYAAFLDVYHMIKNRKSEVSNEQILEKILHEVELRNNRD